MRLDDYDDDYDPEQDDFESIIKRTEAENAAAEAMGADAQFEQGNKFRKSNPYHAVYWYYLAAERGHPGAQYALATMFHYGQGVLRDDPKAKFFYEQLIESEEPILYESALYQLALIYLDSEEVPRDTDEAERLFELAAGRGHIQSMINLALSCHEAQNYDRMREWYEIAARDGYPDAMFALSIIYSDGIGVPRDQERAAWWLEQFEEGVKLGVFESRFGITPDMLLFSRRFLSAVLRGENFYI